MLYSEFNVGSEFNCGDKRWLCTDKGTRVVIAIVLEHSDHTWYDGPPYAVAEHVFDENDQKGCEL